MALPMIMNQLLFFTMGYILRILVFIGGVALLSCLAACGFEPVYANKYNNRQHNLMQHIARVIVDSDAARSSQLLQVALEDIFNPQGQNYDALHGKYRLKVRLRERRQPIIIERTGRVTRYNLNFSAHFSIMPFPDDEPIYKGVARRISSYNVAASDFSTFIGERDARKRGLQELAQDISMQVAAILAERVEAETREDN